MISASLISYLGPIVVSLIGGGVAGTIATRFLIKPYEAKASESLAQVQNELAIERDERKSLRDRIDSQEMKRFDLLQNRRAAVMQEVYAALCDLEDHLDDFARSFGGFIGGPGPADHWRKLGESGTRFRNAFWPNTILFDRDLAASLSALNRAYVAVSNTFGAFLAAERAALPDSKRDDETLRRTEYDALQKTYASKNYEKAVESMRPLREKIEADFRKLYGC